MRIYLGNQSADSVTFVQPPDGHGPRDLLSDLDDLWKSHSPGEPDPTPPLWVAATDDATAQMLSLQFGCPVKPVAEAESAYRTSVGHVA